MSRFRKTNAKGRNSFETGRFARIGHDLLKSQAYRSLSPNARALLIEIVSMENGRNNGLLWLSENDAARRMGVACPKVARRAFQELSDVGFIAMTKDSYFNIKSGERRARAWRLTWIFNVGQRQAASNEWRDLIPTNTAALKRMQRGLRALADYRKAILQNQTTQAKSPSMKAHSQMIQANSPCMIQPTNENSPFCGDNIQCNLPLHTAVTSDVGYHGFGWWQRGHYLRTAGLLAYLGVVETLAS